MPAESESAPESAPTAKSTPIKPEKRQPMPFEPKGRQTSSEPAKPKATPAATPDKRVPALKAVSKPKRSKEGGIPEVVSRRMMRRVAWFSGVPSLLGMSTFVVSYVAVTHDVPLPTYAVLLVSLGWFGLGVLGVSYGVMSASWDEESAGTAVGMSELRVNWSRMSSAWRETREQARQEARQAAKRAKK